MSTQVTYEIDHVSLLKYSTTSSALNFCFLCILLWSKRKISIRRKKNCKKKKFVCEMSIIIILSCQKLGSIGPVQQKSMLPSPNVNLSNLENVLKRNLRTDREYIFGGTTLIMYWLGGNHGGAYVDSIYVRVCPKQNSGYITEDSKWEKLIYKFYERASFFKKEYFRKVSVFLAIVWLCYIYVL